MSEDSLKYRLAAYEALDLFFHTNTPEYAVLATYIIKKLYSPAFRSYPLEHGCPTSRGDPLIKEITKVIEDPFVKPFYEFFTQNGRSSEEIEKLCRKYPSSLNDLTFILLFLHSRKEHPTPCIERRAKRFIKNLYEEGYIELAEVLEEEITSFSK
jgi:hypothetical protein